MIHSKKGGKEVVDGLKLVQSQAKYYPKRNVYWLKPGIRGEGKKTKCG